MLKIKWRTSNQKPYENFTLVPHNYIKRITSLLRPIPFSMQEIRFLINDPTEYIRPHLNSGTNEYLIFRVTQNCYYIEGGMIYSFDTEYGIARLSQENFTHYKIGTNNWCDISNINYGYGSHCVVSWDHNAFSVIGGQFSILDFTSDTEIETYKIIEKSLEDLLANIRIQEFKIW